MDRCASVVYSARRQRFSYCRKWTFAAPRPCNVNGLRVVPKVKPLDLLLLLGDTRQSPIPPIRGVRAPGAP